MKITTETDIRDFEFWSGAKDRVKDIRYDDWDAIEAAVEEVFPEVTIIVHGDIITVEGASDESVSVFDAQGRLVVMSQCNGHCSLVIRNDFNYHSRTTGPVAYWVQVGNRPCQRVFLNHKPSSGIIHL